MFQFARAGSALCAALVALSLGGCSVQLVSPYNEEIASGAAKLHEDVLKTAADIWRKASDPKTQAQAAYENYAATYDDWEARVETLRTMSLMGNPEIFSCAALVDKLRAAKWPGLTIDASEVASAVPPPPAEGSQPAPVDCQSLLLGRLRDRIDQMAKIQQLACVATNPNFRNDCMGSFGPSPASRPIRIVSATQGAAVSAVIRTIEAVMRVQAAKKVASGG